MQADSTPEDCGRQDSERLGRSNNGLAQRRPLVSDICTAEQDYDWPHDVSAVAAMKRLMMAVLEDALRIFQNDADASCGARKRRFDETAHWLCSPGGDGPFAFDTVCEALGIDPGFLRRHLRQWRDERRAGKIQPRFKRRSAVARARRISFAARRINHRGRKAS